MNLGDMYRAGVFPRFLDRALLPDGTRLTTEQIDVIRARLNKAHGTIKIKMPRLKLGGKKRGETGLGVPVIGVKVGKGA